MPQMMSKPKMSCPGASCPGCESANCYAEGGGVEKLHHSPAGGSKNRLAGSNRVKREDQQEGVHRSRSVYSPGESNMGHAVRSGDSEAAKRMVYDKTKQQRPLGKNHGYFAEGGNVYDKTHRRDNEKGINKDAYVNSGRSEAGVALKPAFSVHEDIDKDVAKRKHHKVLSEMKMMKKPNLYAEGGKVEADMPEPMDASPEMDDELSGMMGEELMSALESKDRKRIMESIESIVLSCLSKE